jgi:hypothetical protein
MTKIEPWTDVSSYQLKKMKKKKITVYKFTENAYYNDLLIREKGDFIADDSEHKKIIIEQYSNILIKCTSAKIKRYLQKIEASI